MVSSQAIAATFVLIALQLAVLRASQHAVPSLYFTTSSLFDRRADVSGGAVLFRLSIPLAAGGVAALLAPDNALAVGAISGGGAWFLAIWPIIWNPRLASHRFTLPFVGILVAFLLAFAALPLAGVALEEAISGVISAEGAEWKAQYVWGLITGVTFSIVAEGASWFARTKLSFVDDSLPITVSGSDEDADVDEDADDWLGEEDDLESGLGRFLLLYGAETFGFLSVAVCAISLFLLARRRP